MNRLLLAVLLASPLMAQVVVNDFAFHVVAPPTLTLVAPGTTLPSATGNVTYSQALAPFFTITGGVAPYRFEQTTPLLGLTTNSQGTTISGAPRIGPGSAEVSFVVVDANGATSNATFIGIVILQNPLAFSTPSLPAWTVGRPYQQPVNVEGGSGFYRFTENEGNNYPPGIQPDLKLACPAFAQNPIGNYFISGQASLVGGSGPATYSLGSSSTLPPGLSFSSSGLLSGVIGGGGFF